MEDDSEMVEDLVPDSTGVDTESSVVDSDGELVDDNQHLSRRKPVRNRVAPKRYQYDEPGTPTLRR